MRFGLQIPSFSWPGGPSQIAPTLAAIAHAADEAGFDDLFVMDHFFQIPNVGAAEENMLEGYTALSFLAAHTERARLGTLVTGVTYRHPGVLVKEVTTLDILSGGRAILGVGAAWYEREHIGLGVPFPPLKERFERLEETLQIAHAMWSSEKSTYEGRYYRLVDALNVPQPLSRPHPPILIGGSGEKKTLRLVARYADACNLYGFLPLPDLRHKLDVLRDHCQAEGRPYERIEKTVLLPFDLTQTSPEAVLERIRELRSIGVDTVITSFPDIYTIHPIEVFAQQVMSTARPL